MPDKYFYCGWDSTAVCTSGIAGIQAPVNDPAVGSTGCVSSDDFSVDNLGFRFKYFDVVNNKWCKSKPAAPQIPATQTPVSPTAPATGTQTPTGTYTPGAQGTPTKNPNRTPAPLFGPGASVPDQYGNVTAEGN